MKEPKTKEDLNILAEKTRTNFIKIIPKNKKKIAIKSSKIGGIPYWNNSLVYPQIGGKTAKLMAQINFDELKQQGLSLEDFPDKGILQFYFAEGDDMWGLTFDSSPSNIKVIYHENTDEPSILNKEIKTTAENDDCMPYESPCILNFEISTEVLSLSDEYQASKRYDFDINKISDELMDYMHDEFGNTGSKLGGYAYFTQSDPRAYGEEKKKDWVLLLQIDTDDDAGIMWGDCGVANWFIEREDLKKRDFSKVLFNWDCC